MRRFETKKLRKYSSQLRATMTEAEYRLWYYLRNRHFCGIKFLRQKIIGGYIVDFVSLEIKLVIELDGSQHNEQYHYDQIRTEILKQQGFEVIRFWNNDVLNNIDSVLEVIWQYQDRYFSTSK